MGGMLTNTKTFNPVASAAVQAGSGLLGGIVSGLFNRGAQKRAFDQNVQMWNMQNEYNSPSAQMARLRDAGLNPRLVYGQGSGNTAGNASTLPKYQAPSWDLNLDVSPLQTLGQYADLKAKQAQIGYINTQTQLAKTKENKTFVDYMIASMKQDLMQALTFGRKGQLGPKWVDKDWFERKFDQIRNSIMYQLSATQLGNYQRDYTSKGFANTMREIDANMYRWTKGIGYFKDIAGSVIPKIGFGKMRGGKPGIMNYYNQQGPRYLR